MDDRIILAHVADFAFGSVVVRPATRTVAAAGGAAAVLEPRVMQVLVALALADGAILTREELTRRCWDGRVVGEDAINRVLSRLRRVADGVAAGSFRVETITKVGYRLIADGDPHPPAVRASPVVRARPDRRTFVVGGAVAVAAGVAAWGLTQWAPHAAAADPEPLPADPETAALYLQAREQWAQRQGDSINRAIAGFGTVISRDPTYAPAYAGLADAYVLAREFGSIDDTQAFPRARAAADVALKLDPRSVAALRARGFIQYWWRHRPDAAGRSLRQAIALDPDDAQTHFWYGNMLADNGDFDAGLAELDRARSLNPGSPAIQSDWAWAEWSEGARDRAVTMLTALLRANPELATAHDGLSAIALSEHDLPTYLHHFSVFASARGNAQIAAQAKEEQRVFARSGVAALARSIMGHAAARARVSGDTTWPAFVASSLGDRAGVVAALTTAERAHRCYGGAGQLRQIATRWRGDAQVTDLVAGCRAPTMV